MDGKQVATGVGLAVWGGGCAYLTNVYRTRSDLRSRVARSRWRIDQGTARRRGLTEDEWLTVYADNQRWLATWIGLPVAALFVALSVLELIRGLVS